jgi:manganese efflux pump family protein
MTIIEIILIALGMAMDAFAVCIGIGTSRNTGNNRQGFRLAFHFGLFQFLMPIIGWLAGNGLVKFIAPYDHWIAFFLLVFVGGRMIWSGLHPEKKDEENDPSRGWNLVILSIATSIDALAIGLSLAIVGVQIWYPAVIIGIVTGLISWMGLRLGNYLGVKFGQRMEIIGGILLAIIGVRIVILHILG